MRNSLMFKASYYNFLKLFPQGQAVDRVRGSKVQSTPIELNTIEEAFTSENWIIRIYKVKKPDQLARSLHDAASFERGNKKRKAAKRRGARVLRTE